MDAYPGCGTDSWRWVSSGSVPPRSTEGRVSRCSTSSACWWRWARAAAPEPVVDVAAVAVPLLEELGGDLADEWVPALVSGKMSVAVGLDRGACVENAAAADVLLLGATGASGDAEIHLVEVDTVTTTDRTSVDGSRRLAQVDWEPTSATRIAGRRDARRGPRSRERGDRGRSRGTGRSHARTHGRIRQGT